MIAQPNPPQPRRTHSPRAQARLAITATTLITVTVVPAKAGIQHLGCCGVWS